MKYRLTLRDAPHTFNLEDVESYYMRDGMHIFKFSNGNTREYPREYIKKVEEIE